MNDEIEKSLRGLQPTNLKPRLYKSREELIQLILSLGGPRTAESIRKAMKTLPHERIPFLFSSLDPQLVLDVMANDVDALIGELKRPANVKKSPP